MLSMTSPVDTPFTKIPAAAKLSALCGVTLALFATDDLAIMAGFAAMTTLAYSLGGRTFLLEGLRHLKPLWIFCAVVVIWHIWADDFEAGLVVSLRLIVAVSLANLVTMTTRFDALIAVVTRLFSPLRRFGLSPKILGFAVGLVIRFIPAMIARGVHLQEAWRARSRTRPKWNIILPLAVLALDDADHVAEALRARGGFSTNQKGMSNGA